jgi:hypothetical protein
MKCFYQVEGGEWCKGSMMTFGGTNLIISKAVGEMIAVGPELSFFGEPEVIFHGNGMTVTGFVRKGDTEDFRLVTVEVRPGWTKPK